MLTGNNDDAREARQLVGLIIVGSCILILAGLFALWRNYQLAGDQSWLSQFSRVAIDSMPLSLRLIVSDQARVMGLPLAADSQAYWYLARAGGVVDVANLEEKATVERGRRPAAVVSSDLLDSTAFTEECSGESSQ